MPSPSTVLALLVSALGCPRSARHAVPLPLPAGPLCPAPSLRLGLQGSPDTAAPAPTREGGKVGKWTLTRVCRTNDPAPTGGQLGHRLWSLPCPQHLLLSWGPGVLSASPWEPAETGGQPRMGACPDAEALERFACMGQKPARGRCTDPPPRRGASEGGASPRCRHCLAGPAALTASERTQPSFPGCLCVAGRDTPPRPQACLTEDPCVLQALAPAPPLGISL